MLFGLVMDWPLHRHQILCYVCESFSQKKQQQQNIEIVIFDCILCLVKLDICGK